MKHPLIFWKTVLICLMLAGKTGTYADNYQHLTLQPAFIHYPTQDVQYIV